MKKKRFSDPVIEITTADLNGDVGGSNFGGGDLNSIRPMPMSFDEWTQSTFCGDVDGSGTVTSNDALLLMRFVMNMVPASELDLSVADFNDDGVTNANDALAIMRLIMGVRTSLQ